MTTESKTSNSLSGVNTQNCITLSDIESEPAGRRLDAWVAEKVMGWTGQFLVALGARSLKSANKWQTAFKSDSLPYAKSALGHSGISVKQDGTKLFCGEPHKVLLVPYYSGSISAAWEVARKAGLCYIPVLSSEQEACAWVCKNALRVANGYEPTNWFRGGRIVYSVEEDGTVTDITEASEKG